MLRFVGHRHAVHMAPVLDDGVAVDTPEDLARAERLFNQYGGAVLTRGTAGRSPADDEGAVTYSGDVEVIRTVVR
ncbi:hypothetical protein ACWZEH_26435 [Streptomyces sp. QTS137]